MGASRKRGERNLRQNSTNKIVRGCCRPGGKRRKGRLINPYILFLVFTSISKISEDLIKFKKLKFNFNLSFLHFPYICMPTAINTARIPHNALITKLVMASFGTTLLNFGSWNPSIVPPTPYDGITELT